ncbi:hypothetical protein Ccrd_004423 [Cynara cardunculus var. scolymus]|uniref:YTH domain-containing protein n=1 Tax=Cynara cardunculus var. scolymus TaxID=59895 RepID=A0A103XMJ6_CYNCS|nr:hypothetical protein Ccrd_004423 [Cynara cardunculus var. scolymus]
MPGDKQIVQSEPIASGLKSDARAKMDDQNPGSRKDGIVSGVAPPFSGGAISSAKGGVANKTAAEQGVHYPPTSCYDYQYPGHNGPYSQLDGSGHATSGGGAYTDSGSLLYYMPGYNPYTTGNYMGLDGQQPYFSSSEVMPCYSWNSTTYSGDTTNRNGTSMGTKSNGIKSNDLNSKRTMNSYTGKSSNYPLDMKSRQQSTSSIPKSILQSQHLRSLNKKSGERIIGEGSHDPTSSLINLTRNLSLKSNSNSNSAKPSIGDKSSTDGGAVVANVVEIMVMMDKDRKPIAVEVVVMLVMTMGVVVADSGGYGGGGGGWW